MTSATASLASAKLVRLGSTPASEDLATDLRQAVELTGHRIADRDVLTELRPAEWVETQPTTVVTGDGLPLAQLLQHARHPATSCHATG